jgi:hypothetical protein
MLIRLRHEICGVQGMPDFADILEPFLTQLCGHPAVAVIVAVAVGMAIGLFFRGAHGSVSRFRYRFLGLVLKKGRRHCYRRRRAAATERAAV